jgi:hypothetical protein
MKIGNSAEHAFRITVRVKVKVTAKSSFATAKGRLEDTLDPSGSIMYLPIQYIQ